MKSISKICLALILVCAITFPAIAQEKKPVEPLKPEKTPVPVRVPAPDLVVKEIKCGPGNKLQFTVANIGTAPLPSGWRAVADVFFDGTRMGHPDLGRPISGDVTPVGGSANYLTAFDITRPVAVKVVVDATNSIKESNEGNNSLETKLACEAQTGPCYIAGRYKGIAVDSPTCPVGPKTGTVILILTQAGSLIEGDMIDPATGAVTSKLKGTVTTSGKGCKMVARSKGVPGGPDEKCIHDVKATLFKNRLGKWETVDGVYTDLSGLCCSGTFKMQQQ